MATTEHIGFRCPANVVAAIKERMNETGMARTEIIVAALEKYLGLEEPDVKVEIETAIASLRKEFQQEIAELREKIAA